MGRNLAIAVVPGDGIGPEVTRAALEVLAATGLPLDFLQAEVGVAAFRHTGTSVPPEALTTCKGADAVLFGATSTPPGLAGYHSAILTLRSELDLWANLRPARSVPLRVEAGPQGAPPERASWLGAAGLDLLLVRENSEGLYSGIERREGDRAVAERVITRAASERIARVAFEQAQQRRAASVLAVHKANVLRVTDGLFLDSCRTVAASFPGIQLHDGIVDSVAAQLVLRPSSLQVLVTTNLFGDILSDVAAAQMGSLGLAASANLGDRHALFEPVHGSAPDIAGKGLANPVGAIRSAALLLEHLGEGAWARRVEAAVDRTLQHAATRTRDVGGSARTEDVAQAIVKELDA